MTETWHALPPDEVLRRLESREAGLDGAEAAARLRRDGPNVFERVPPASVWSVLVAQLRSVVVLLLVAAAGAALLSGDALDAAAIGAVLVLNVAIGFTTELRAHRAMEALLRLDVARATVVREGHSREIDARELVAGDVVVLEPGSTVPADARLLRATELRTVEASLTGESLPVSKHAEPVPADASLPDRRSMVYKATAVAAGRATAVVIATGMRTEVGRIGTLTAGVVERRTPLEQRLDALGRRLVGAALAVAVVVAVLGYLQGQPLGALLQTALALAVAAVPEGLPVVGTIAMAVGVRRMARRRALIRHLPVVETLGSATVICTDKTGTLTAGEMTATVLRLADREVALPLADFSPDRDTARALRVAALASRGEAIRTAEGWRTHGDPTETALLVAAGRAGFDLDQLRLEWPEVAEVPFSSERLLMATFRRTPDGTATFVKGAPRRVLELCEWVSGPDGRRHLAVEERERLQQLNLALAGRGLRVLAIATKDHVESPAEAELRGLTWLGLVGLTDPPAPGVADTIRAFRAAGIRTVMLTGDQELTGASVARALTLLGDGERTLGGREVDRLDGAALRAAVGDTRVFSRVSPEAKLRIVAAFQDRGEVVAMLGDGVNDAAALRQADIGVAMGGRGTDLAKEAADLILADDRFPTIGAAIEQGRIIFDNIRKFVFYLFSCNLAEILVVLGAGLAGHPSPLLPLQILWLNLLTDTFPALALAVEPGEPDIMRQAPRDPRATLLSGGMIRATLVYGGLIAACSLAAYAWGASGEDGTGARASTLAFLTLAFAQVLHLGNARSGAPVLAPRRALANRWALGAVVLALALQLVAVYYAPLARVLQVRPPGAVDWLVVLTLALVPAVVGQTAKALRRR